MAELPASTLRLRIDHAALAANWRALDRMSGRAKAGAAVKAECYGLGVDACLPTLRDCGAQRFYAAHWSEVPQILAHVPAASVRVLHGPLTPAEAQYARDTGAVPVINSLHQAQVWQESGGGVCDLMIDTGINRLGISPDDCSDPAIQSLEIDCLMSHLACADEESGTNAAQLRRFKQCAQTLEFGSLSLANSAGIALGRGYSFDWTRPGLALYGGIARREYEGVIAQVAFPQAALLQRRRISAGARIGYNAAFTATRDMEVGVVSLGYADGLLRLWGPLAQMRYQGAKLDMLGKISMDMVVIDLTHAPQLREGDFVELPYALPEAARQSALSQYELLTLLGTRLTRM